MQDSKFGEHLYLTPRVPQGLAAAVEGLTREVIRHRPENIYAFAARHFENLLRLREQYDDPQSSSKNDTKDLHEVNEALKECHEESEHTNECARQSGWSMNETAKVLEKHRSIFGDSGQKVSTDQIRELANEPVLTSRDRLQEGSPKRKVDRSNEEDPKDVPGSSRRKESAHNAQVASKNGVRNAPKMLSQIPIAKDIKTELKRNRISSRERKKVVACEYTRETIIEKSSKKSFEKTKKSYEVRSEKKSSRTEDSSTKKRTETMKSRSNSQEEKKLPRATSMDSVKNYVVQNFVGMTSLDELQTPSYVEKVQEVIDETSSIIKEKVEALKSGVVRAAKAKQMKKEISMSSDDQSKSSSKSDSDRRNQEASLSRRNSKVAQDSLESANNKNSLDQSDGKDASESSLPAVRPPSAKSISRSVSARSESDAALTLPPISPESAKSPKAVEDLVLPALSPPRTTVSPEEALDVPSADDTTAAVDEIAEDPTVSSDNILDNKVVEKVDEKTLPAAEKSNENITPSKETLVSLDESVEKAESSKEAEENLVISEENTDEKAMLSTDLVAEKTEESSDGKLVPSEKSSLEKVVTPKESDDEKNILPENITSDKLTEESNKENVLPVLEITNKNNELFEQVVTETHILSEVTIEEKVEKHFLEVKEEEFHDSLNVTPEPFDTKGQRPDSLENSLAEDKSPGSSGHVSPLETLKDKLLEIEEVQKRIEDVLDDTKTSKAEDVEKNTNEVNSGSIIGDKLVEIQESEKRIEQILDSQSTTETLNSDIKNKLKELEEAERRIENILGNEVIKECSDKTNTPGIDVEESVEVSNEDVDDSKAQSVEETTATTNENLSVPSENKVDEENSRKVTETRAVSPHSYILTEGSPYEIPDSVTTVIIPERTPSPDSESLQVEDVEDHVTFIVSPKETDVIKVEEHENNSPSSINEAFGEAVQSSEESPSTVDREYIRGIKASHDMIASRENLDRIKEERDEADVIDSEDEKVLKVVTSSLEEILEKEEVEYVRTEEVHQTVKLIEVEKHETLLSTEVVEYSLESTAKIADKKTDISESSSLDPGVPIVPELNLDSLPDLTISSFNISEKDASSAEASLKKEEEDSLEVGSETETQEFEKLEERCSDEPTAASDIGVAAPVDINNVVCPSTAKESENNLLAAGAAASQCTETTTTTTTTASIEENRHTEKFESEANDHADEKKPYHIYVPEASSSKDVSSSTETSTFMSAATKIQAGVRGFLTRRRLQSTQKRSSTLDSVPSIQESFAVEASVSAAAGAALMPIVETASSLGMSEAKARKKLRREDAVQRTTLSVENAFADNQLQHTGEFHDCIPLPVFDAEALSMKSVKERQEDKAKEAAARVEQLLEKILLGQAAANFAAHPKLVDVVLLPPPPTADSDIQNKYLNFITSVEDVFSDLPETPKGVIIEEITSLDEASKSISEEVNRDDNSEQLDKPSVNDGEETLASISTSEEPMSINIEEVLGLGEEDEVSRQSKRLNVKLSTVDQIRSSSVSQDSPVSDERTRSPVTMMQIAPKSVDEKSDENPS